jgi:hypothetical protein
VRNNLRTSTGACAVLAVALFAGLRGSALGRSALFFLPLTWFAGCVLGVLIQGVQELPLPAISFLVMWRHER